LRIVELTGDVDNDIYSIVDAINDLKSSTGKPVMVQINLERIYHFYTSMNDRFAIISNIISHNSVSKDILVFPLGSDCPLKTTVVSLADNHIKLMSSCFGTLFLYGIKPKTRLYGIQYEDCNIKLIPIS